MATKHSIVLVQLDNLTKDRLKLICKRRGMTRVEMVSRLVRWFSLQDDYTQNAVVEAVVKGSMAGVARSVLKRAASE
jgi:hypothetical protein